METFTYPVPDLIISIGNIFRATGRLFWPVYYVIVIGIFYSVWNGFSRKVAISLVFSACVVQIIDTAPGYQVVSTSMSFTRSQPLTDPAWNEIAKRYKQIIIAPIGDDPAVHQPQWESIALFAAQHKMSTNAAYLARPFRPEKIAKLNASYLSTFNSKSYNHETVYVLNQNTPNINLPYPIQLNPSDVITRIDGINLLLPNWNDAISQASIPAARINHRIPINSQYGLPFLIGNVGNYTMNYGWAFPESWGTWSNGSESDVSLIIPPGNSKFIEFEIKGFINAAHPRQHFSILIENQKVYDGVINSHQVKKIRLPIPPSKDMLNLNVKFLLPDAVRPKDVGGGDDHRKLGIALISAQFIQ
jgi:hypothetical protein